MKRYNKTFRMKVVRDALKPEFKDKEFLIAEKYGVRESTILKWVKLYEEYGDKGLSKNLPQLNNTRKSESEKDKKIKELEEEIEILKKAAAFLAKIDRD